MTPATLQRSLEISPHRVGRPRLHPYKRLFSRFYEQLFLLNALGQTRGSHTILSSDVHYNRAQSRRLLQNLCFVCDFKKGGSTCTAIGLEELDTHYNFCVASNRETDTIVAFLRTALGALRARLCPVGTENIDSELRFAKMCIEFAAERINEEKKCLRRYAKHCLSRLSGQIATSDLATWLHTVMGIDDKFELCNFAHNDRHSVHMRELERRGTEEEISLDPTNKRSPFALTRHYIGRLAHHIRASQELIQDAEELSHLFESHAVCPIYAVPAVPTPICDAHTNLQGILKRMLKNDREKDKLEEGLLYLNRVAGIFDTFIDQYNGSTREVHAEVQILENFWEQQRSFADADRFVACSKPACLCCELYFQYHPARVMLFSSHRKIWTKWSPPNVERFDQRCPAATQQRDIVNRMTEYLREQVLSQVFQSAPSKQWHPDSITNITNNRPLSFKSDSIMISYVEAARTLPRMNLGLCHSRRAILGKAEAAGSLDVASDLDDFSDSGKGGVSLSGYT
ncbi:unnamed protein product [Penicillium salamii]|nr:unnamed protein product [Penicillium salamii]